MASFAKLNENNEVTTVIKVDDNQIIDKETGEEDEILGIAFCKQLFGGRWLQTSFSGKIRKRCASPGMLYNEQYDAFIHPKPFPSWIFNEETLDWEAPKPKPTPETTPNPPEEKTPVWDEDVQEWVFG